MAPPEPLIPHWAGLAGWAAWARPAIAPAASPAAKLRRERLYREFFVFFMAHPPLRSDYAVQTLRMLPRGLTPPVWPPMLRRNGRPRKRLTDTGSLPDR